MQGSQIFTKGKDLGLSSRICGKAENSVASACKVVFCKTIIKTRRLTCLRLPLALGLVFYLGRPRYSKVPPVVDARDTEIDGGGLKRGSGDYGLTRALREAKALLFAEAGHFSPGSPAHCGKRSLMFGPWTMAGFCTVLRVPTSAAQRLPLRAVHGNRRGGWPRNESQQSRVSDE